MVPSARLELARTMFTDPSNQPVYQFQHDGKTLFLAQNCKELKYIQLTIIVINIY